MKNNIIFYKEWLILINSLPDHKRLKFYDLIFSLEENNLPNIKDQHLKSVFDFISKKIIENNQKYRKKCDKARESANSRWNKNSMPTNANACDRIETHYDTVPDPDNEKKDIKKKKSKTTLSKDFHLTKETIKKLKEEGYAKEQMNKKIISFKDYWFTEREGKEKKHNWQTAFRNSIRRDKPWKKSQEINLKERIEVEPLKGSLIATKQGKEISKKILSNIEVGNYNSWFSSLKVKSFKDEKLIFIAPSKFVSNHININWGHKIKKMFNLRTLEFEYN